jgi:hypothetical protein
MSINITIIDNRTNKEFTSKSDKFPVNKIIKVPNLTLHCVRFTITNDAIIMIYHYNEIETRSYSFRKYSFPNDIELNDNFIDELIELIYTKLYESDVYYIAWSKDNVIMSECILDTYEYNGLLLIKYKNDYKFIRRIKFVEKNDISDNLKKLLLSEEPEYKCPDEFSHIDWVNYLGFQPNEIKCIIKCPDSKTKVIAFYKDKLNIEHFIFLHESEELDLNTRYTTIYGKNDINFAEPTTKYIIDKIELDDAIIIKTYKNIFVELKISFERK